MAATPANQKRRIWSLRLFFLLALPLILFTRSSWAEPDWLFDILEVLGIFLIIAGVLGRFWAILYIGARKNREIVQDGPYALCRHPLYLSSTLGVLGFGLMLGSFFLTAFLGLCVFIILSSTAAREEAYLRAEFGPAYARYAAQVPRIWPRLRGFQTEPVLQVSVAALRSNFADALVFLALIPLAELMEFLHGAALWPAWPLF